MKKVYSIDHERNIYKNGKLYWTEDGVIVNMTKKKCKKFDYNTESFIEVIAYCFTNSDDYDEKLGYMAYIGTIDDEKHRMNIKNWKKVNTSKEKYTLEREARGRRTI